MGDAVPFKNLLDAQTEFCKSQNAATLQRLIQTISDLGQQTGTYRVQDAVQQVFRKKLASGTPVAVRSLAHFQELVCRKWLRRDRANTAETLLELERQTNKLAASPSPSRALAVLAYAATACGAAGLAW